MIGNGAVETSRPPSIGEMPPPYQPDEPLPPYDHAFLTNGVTVTDEPRVRIERRTGRALTPQEFDVVVASNRVKTSLAAVGVTLTGCLCGGVTTTIWGYAAAVPCATYVGWPLTAVCCVATSCASLNSVMAMLNLRDLNKQGATNG